MSITVEPTAEDLAKTAARTFIEAANAAIQRQRRFTVALAGGSTPKRMYEVLGSPEFRSDVDWSRVLFFWSDERTVPPEHEESNFRLAQLALLQYLDVSDEQIFRMRGEIDPAQAAQEYERALAEVFKTTRPYEVVFDLMLLGMGTDGHTASLFPETDALNVTDRLAVENYVPQMNTMRLTLTRPVITSARQTMMLVAGEEKAPAVQNALQGQKNIFQTPSQILRDGTGDVRWILDSAAASQLSDGT